MKLSTKIFLPIILISALLILLIGCFPTINRAPIITSDPDPDFLLAEVGTEYTYDVNATDPDGDILTYSLDVFPKDMTIVSANGEISWIPTNAQIGDNLVTVKVSDGVLDITQTFTIEVSLAPGLAPAEEEEEEVVYTGGGGGGYTPAVVDPCADNTPPTISNITNTLSVGTPPCDRFGALEIATCSDTYQVETSDPDDQTALYYELAGEPSGMTIDNSGLITWEPVPCPGTWGVKVRVRDECGDFGEGGTYDEVHFQVTSANTPPTISNITNTLSVGTPPCDRFGALEIAFCSDTYKVEASDDDTCQTALYYELAGEPSGMSINNSGLITWDPVPCPDTWGVKVRVRDECGDFGEVGTYDEVHFQVTSINSEPVIGEIEVFNDNYHYWYKDDLYIFVGLETLKIVIPASDEDGCQSLTFSLNAETENGDDPLPTQGLRYGPGPDDNIFTICFDANCYSACDTCPPDNENEIEKPRFFLSYCWWHFIVRVTDGCDEEDSVDIYVRVNY